VGRFVAFEGIDGSGKTTVAKAVHDALASRGLDVVLTSEPTRTWAGEAVRTAILDALRRYRHELDTLIALMDTADPDALRAALAPAQSRRSELFK